MTTSPDPSPPSEPFAERARLTAGRSENRARSQLVGVRFTPDELIGARALAAAHGLSVPDLLRKCLLAVQLDEAKRETGHAV